MTDETVPNARLQAVDRAQLVLRPVIVENLIAEDHPARAIWAFVGRLDLSRYVEQVRSVEGTAGRPAWDPHVLVSLWIYSYSRGVSSARAIAALCDDDPVYQWLTGMSSISGHTLSDFRVGYADALRDLFVQVLALLSAEGLITLERVMQDGTKIRAMTGRGRFRSRSRIEAYLAQAHATVAALEALPDEESTRRQQRARERAAHQIEARLTSALTQFEQLAESKSRMDRVSTTDPEARMMRQGDGGTAPSYNVQIATDATHTLIVDIDATQAGSDYRQLTPAVERIEHHLQRVPDQMVVDAGYLSNDNIVAMADRGIELIGPEAPGPDADANSRKSYQYRSVHADFETAHFRYESSGGRYQCPQGKTLRYAGRDRREGHLRVRYQANVEDCAACPAKPLCCPRTKGGRSIYVNQPIPAVSAFRQKMQTEDARAIYRTRSPVAEFPNLWIKTKLGLRQFRVRGLAKVRLECLWAALTYDIHHWIRLTRQLAARPVPA